MLTREDLARELRSLGLGPGDLVMVHASMRALGPLLGGPDVVIRALLDVVGAAGTLAAYLDWEHAAQAYVAEDPAGSLPPERLAELPAFDPATARAARSHGVFAEFLRTWPGAVRSANPGASVGAVGARAEWLCAEHPLNYGYGPGSPFAKLIDAGGKVLLLGSHLAHVTLLHHAEHVARLPDKRVIRFREPILEGGVSRWVEIEEFDTSRPIVSQADDEYFDRLMSDYLATGAGSTGRVGSARAYLLDAGDLDRFAVRWMEARWGHATTEDG
jgi:aminoglycoside 3-N-acetyltransferase